MHTYILSGALILWVEILNLTHKQVFGYFNFSSCLEVNTFAIFRNFF